MSRLVFDIGGTHMRLALAEGGELQDIEKTETPERPEAAVERIRAYIVTRNVTPDSIVGGVAGVIRDGVVVYSPHLLGWNTCDFAAALSSAVNGIPVSVHNDADIAGLAEARAGAGKGHAIVAYIGVGTGVGGTLVLDGNIAPHAEGIEPGKQIIDYEHRRTLEQLVGGAALAIEFGAPPEKLSPAIFSERTVPFTIGIYNSLRHWSPDVLVLGGPLVNDETGYRIDTIRTILATLAPGWTVPPVVPAILGDRAGLYGAAIV